MGFKKMVRKTNRIGYLDGSAVDIGDDANVLKPDVGENFTSPCTYWKQINTYMGRNV